MYYIKSIQTDEQGTHTLFLVPESGRDFWTDWVNKKRTHEVAIDFASLVFRLQEKGISWAVASNHLKFIDGNLWMAEVKNFNGIWRVICVVTEENPENIVMLRCFRGHQGGSKIPPILMKECKKLAIEAKKQLKEAETGGDNI